MHVTCKQLRGMDSSTRTIKRISNFTRRTSTLHTRLKYVANTRPSANFASTRQSCRIRGTAAGGCELHQRAVDVHHSRTIIGAPESRAGRRKGNVTRWVTECLWLTLAILPINKLGLIGWSRQLAHAFRPSTPVFRKIILGRVYFLDVL